MEQDIRIERTKTALREAFCALVQKTPAYAISVTNLTKKAGVSRVTFYIHYKDMADFIEKTCQWTADELIWEPAEEMNIFNMENAQLVCTKQVEAMRESAELFRALLGPNGPNFFLNIIVDTIEKEYRLSFERVRDKFRDDQELNDLIKYITAGELALLVDWIMSETMAPTKEMVEKILEFTYQGELTGLHIME